MTCIQRDFLIFITSIFILILCIQNKSVSSHKQHHNHHHSYSHQNQHNQHHLQQNHHQHQIHHHDVSTKLTSGQSHNHLRHHHVPLRNRQQVQYYNQHKISLQTTTTSTNTADKSSNIRNSKSRSSSTSTAIHSNTDGNILNLKSPADKLLSDINSHEFLTKYKIYDQRRGSDILWNSNNRNNNNNIIGSNRSTSSASVSADSYNNNNNNNNRNSNNNNHKNTKSSTQNAHHQSNNSQEYNLKRDTHRIWNEPSSKSKSSLLVAESTPILPELNNEKILIREHYHQKPFESKVHTTTTDDRDNILNDHALLSKTSQQSRESPINNSRDLFTTLPQVKNLEHSDDDDDDYDDKYDTHLNGHDNLNDKNYNSNKDVDYVVRGSQQINFSNYAVTPVVIRENEEKLQNLQNDFTYDYLYDEPMNNTDTKPAGTLTEVKWRNYGTAEAVEKSRRRHMSEAQIIAAHITRINMEAMCKYPKPKIIQINEASKRYVPHCTVLHRCGDDTGCCHSETQTCAAKKTVTVDLYFYAIPLKTKDPTVEMLSFVNHTECHCIDKYLGRSLTPNILSDGSSSIFNGTCNCIRHFNAFQETFDNGNDNDDDVDYQQSDSFRNNHQHHYPNCRCDCTSDNLTCQRLKRGQEGIPVDDRKCILEGRCRVPVCEYGIFNRQLGRCPRSQSKRQISTTDTRLL